MKQVTLRVGLIERSATRCAHCKTCLRERFRPAQVPPGNRPLWHRRHLKPTRSVTATFHFSPFSIHYSLCKNGVTVPSALRACRQPSPFAHHPALTRSLFPSVGHNKSRFSGLPWRKAGGGFSSSILSLRKPTPAVSRHISEAATGYRQMKTAQNATPDKGIHEKCGSAAPHQIRRAASPQFLPYTFSILPKRSATLSIPNSAFRFPH